LRASLDETVLGVQWHEVGRVDLAVGGFESLGDLHVLDPVALRDPTAARVAADRL
jgi:hypothetical protein